MAAELSISAPVETVAMESLFAPCTRILDRRIARAEERGDLDYEVPNNIPCA